MEKRRIAIVGSGCAGIGALYALKDTDHEVQLFEAADRLGGHTNTVIWQHDGEETPVDTGFIVMNTHTYPNFIAFLKTLNIDTIATDMTFSVSRDLGLFEWAGTSPGSIFAQPGNILKLSMWQMIFDIIRFNLFSLDLVRQQSSHPDFNLSIGEYLARECYSKSFRDDYLIPMTACVWSTGADKCALDFPAVTLVRFLWNHHLLNTFAPRPRWLTIPGGSKRYIDAVMGDFPKERVHLNTPVQSATGELNGRVELRLADGRMEVFDDVIFACHGDQIYDIIKDDATDKETEIMSSFETTENEVFLHSDLSLMPQRRITWSAWNYLTTSSGPPQPSDGVYKKHLSSTSNGVANGGPSIASSSDSPSGTLSQVSLTYNMNILQHLPVSRFGDVLVTMNPPHAPSPSTIQKRISYTHPLYNARSVSAQERLPEIQGKRGLWYSGAWTGYGFHEDGFGSGVRVAVEGLGGSVPWKVVDAKFSRGRVPEYGVLDYTARAVVGATQAGFMFVALMWGLLTGGNEATERLRKKNE